VPRLLVVTPRELTHDVRARRQVLGALERGLEVVGLCIQLPGEEPAPLPGVELRRAGAGRVSGGLRRAGLGGWRRSRAPIRELRGLYRLARLAKTTVLLVRAGRDAGTFDIVHANDLESLPAAFVLARRWRARLVYDAHELYSEIEPDPPRLYARAALFIERGLARRADVVMTNCPLFAEFIEQRLGLASRPVLVLNCPDLVADEPVRAAGERLRVVYQAAVDHEGRPVSDLLEAAALAPDVDVTIRLVQVDRERVEREISRLGIAGRARLEPPVPVERLVDAMRGYDVGVVINRPLSLNDELALPGKIFEYMMAGLAVVSSRLRGVLPVVEDEHVGATYAPGATTELAAVLQELALDRGRLEGMQRRARELAVERYNAATQLEALVTAWSTDGAPAAAAAARS
jgi:glycosyltransferase involved in cell wall biosynthesis